MSSLDPAIRAYALISPYPPRPLGTSEVISFSRIIAHVDIFGSRKRKGNYRHFRMRNLLPSVNRGHVGGLDRYRQ